MGPSPPAPVVEAQADAAALARAALDRGLDAAVRELPSRGPLVVLCSGGVDSGVLATRLRERPQLVAAVVGVAGSPDLAAGRAAAEAIGIPSAVVAVDEDAVRSWAGWIDGRLGPLPPTQRAIATAFVLAVANAPAGPIVVGQGADELFFGYAHYRRGPASEAFARAEADLARLRSTDWPRCVGLAAALGREVHAPFLAEPFVAAARSIPEAIRWAAPPPKALWRAYAAARGVPPAVAGRPKKAWQYGSGVDRALRRAGPSTAPSRP